MFTIFRLALVFTVLTPGAFSDLLPNKDYRSSVLQIIQQSHQKMCLSGTKAMILKLIIYSRHSTTTGRIRCQTVQLSHDEFLRVTITLQFSRTAAFQPREHSLPVQQKERGNLPRCDFLNAKLYLHPLQTSDITEHGTSEALGDAGEATFG